MSKITSIKTTKDYAVVSFVKFDTYSEIPTNWLLYNEKFKDKIACWWPKKGTKNIARKIKNRETPPKDWPVYEIQILRYCSTLESARKAAEDSQYDSQISSAPEPRGRGHRKRKVTSPVRDVLKINGKKNKIHSSSSDDDDSPVPALPQLPQYSPSKSSSYLKRNNQEDSSSQSSHEVHDDDSDGSLTRSMDRAKALLNNHKSKQDEPGATASGSNGVSDKDSDVKVKHELRLFGVKLDTCVFLLGKLLTEVKDLKQRNVLNNNGNSSLDSAISAEVESHLKLDTQERVAAFEVRLKSCKTFEDEFVRKVKQIGGANGKYFTERALAFIFSDKFAKENTWGGKITKYKGNALKVIDICEKVILEKFPTWDKAEFGKAGTNWFRLGNQRAGEQAKQVIKKTILMDEKIQSK